MVQSNHYLSFPLGDNWVAAQFNLLPMFNKNMYKLVIIVTVTFS